MRTLYRVYRRDRALARSVGMPYLVFLRAFVRSWIIAYTTRSPEEAKSEGLAYGERLRRRYG